MKGFSILLLASLVSSDVFSQTVEFTATTNKAYCSEQQVFRITFSLNFSAESDSFIFPDFGRLKVAAGPNLSQMMRIIDGKQTSSTEFSYSLYAEEAGDYTIPPAGYMMNGDTLFSNPVGIKVKQSTGKVSDSVEVNLQEDDLLFRLEPDKLTGDLNDTFFIAWKLYTEADLVYNNISLGNTIPDYFIAEHDTQSAYWDDTVLNGKKYRVATVMKSSWYPLKAGKIHVSPLELSLIARVRVNSDNFFATYKDVPVTLKSDSLTFEVNPVSVLTHPTGRRAGIIEALAKQKIWKPDPPESKGCKIIFLTDVSGSMLIKDFEPGRIPAIKSALSDFVTESKYDLIGLITFSDSAVAACNPGTDYKKLRTAINLFTEDTSASASTAIGNALLEATDLLKNYDGQKVIVLITDGVSNTFISPPTAAEVTGKLDITVYTIGIGADGKAPYPYKVGSQIINQDIEIIVDEPTLQKIADISGGKYFRARNEEQLKQAVMEIRKLL